MPQITRCCFCLPLRKGLLVSGYIFMVFLIGGVAIISRQIQVEYELHERTRRLPYEPELSYYIIKIIFTAAFLVGAHMKRLLLIKVYYYFGCLSLVTDVLFISLLFAMDSIFKPIEHPENFIAGRNMFPGSFTAVVMLCNIVVKVYTLVLIRFLIKKLELEHGDNIWNTTIAREAAPQSTCDEVLPLRDTSSR